MQYFYFDTSALVKRYARENGTPLINFLFAQVPLERLMCSMISVGEIFSVLVRKKNDNRITVPMFQQAIVDYRVEVVSLISPFVVTSVDDNLILDSIDLIEIHNINSNDALVLRSALDTNADLSVSQDNIVFIASDERIIRAAKDENLAVFNPEVGSQTDLENLLDEGGIY